VAIIVSIESVDWEEMEFFDLAARVSRDTAIYVTGHDHYRAKIEAALQRGARRFSADDLTQDLARPAPGSQRTTAHELLAGTLQSFPQAPARQLHVTLVPEEAPTVEPKEPEVEAPTPEPEIESSDKPPVRLVTPADADDDSLAPVDEFDTSIPFPWAPAANRPKRTPPSARVQPEAASTPRTPPTEPHPPPAPTPRSASPELTPEELAALLGRPGNPPSAAARAEARGSLGRPGNPPPPAAQEQAL
jgi:hypothetical protein